jgi:hypothetical protein
LRIKARVRDHLSAMTEPRPSQVLGGLPRSRPHRRSQRRPAVQPIPEPALARATTSEESTVRPALQDTKTKAGAANPAARATAGAANPAARATAGAANPAARATAVPLTPPVTPGAKATRTDVLGTAVQAAAELAEIGLTVGARTLRNALSRLPHP